VYVLDLFERSVSGFFSRRPPHQALFDQSRAGKGLIMSSFIAKKLDTTVPLKDTSAVRTHSKQPTESSPIMGLVRRRIERTGERLWRLEDFDDLPFSAVAQSLSRLTREGAIERLSKGVYYRARTTTFGKSLPSPTAIQKLASQRKTVYPAGIAAANLLGFTTQTARRSEVSTSALSVPRKLIGSETVVHTRRPEAWGKLSEADAALLDFLRRGAKSSELSPAETIDRTVALLSESGRFERLLKVADSEPPRVRAILGAIGEQIGKTTAVTQRLQASLNPFSKFDFGLLAGLPGAGRWQAKGIVNKK
jgi:hypothetical protein